MMSHSSGNFGINKKGKQKRIKSLTVDKYYIFWTEIFANPAICFSLHADLWTSTV